jgi:ribosomal protein L29
MNRLVTRITKLERLLPVGPEAELRALSDEELERRLDESLMRASEEHVQAMARKYPNVLTPKVVARWRALQGEPTRGKQAGGDSTSR